MDQVLDFILVFLYVYLLCMFVWSLLSWIPMLAPGLSSNPLVGQVRSFLDSIIMPYVKVFSFIKPIQAGGMLLDLSSLVAFIVLLVAIQIVGGLAA